ncbi:MAG: hypothetical protein ABFD80_10805, partial [Acidobacteriota bacterium]
MQTRRSARYASAAIILTLLCFSFGSGRPAPAERGTAPGGATHVSLVPLLWTQGQPAEAIRAAVREVAESGNTGFVWESRPHPDYLGEGWWRDLETAVAEAERLGLEVWIFDEWMYPSGLAGGRVVKENSSFTRHVVVDRSVAAGGPQPEKEWVLPGGLAPNETLVSVAAFPEPFKSGGKIVGLTPAAAGRQAPAVRWAVPEGGWRLVWSVARREAPLGGWRMDTMVDVLNPEATAAYVRLTHEATYKRLGAHFGKTIKGFFSDETGFRNVTSYKSLPGEPGMPMPWSPAFPAYFKKLKGYDPAPLLPSLWYDLGPAGRAARFDLMDAYSRSLAENYFKPQQEWCRAHGVRLIGHLIEDNGADLQLGYGPGHWFRSMDYFDDPGIDVVGYQVTPGLDAGANPWVFGDKEGWDQEFFQFGVPALARGSALMKRSREIFSEAFGANGWCEGLRMAKWIGDWHIVNGFNLISPHAFTMKYNDPDCPPHFNRMSGNPQARYYAVWAEYFKRLQALTLATEPEYDVAVLYTAESVWAGPAATVAPVVRLLELGQVRTVVLPYDVFAREGRIRAGRWEYNGQSFKAVVLPAVQYVPVDAIRRLADYAEAGGRAVVVDRWPEGSVDGRADEAVVRAVAGLRSAASTVLAARPELPSVFATEAGESLSPASTSIVISRRKGSDGEWLLVHNRSLDSAYKGRLLVRGAGGSCVLMDAEKGADYAVPSSVTADGLAIEIDIPPYGLWCLRLSASPAAAPARAVFKTREDIAARWQMFEVGEDGAEGRALSASPLGDWRRVKGCEKYAGTIRYRAEIDLPAAAASGPL